MAGCIRIDTGSPAMEDCDHLVRLLCRAEPFTEASLEAAFTVHERIRIPIVTKSVGQAKKQGQRRVLCGREAWEMRDEAIFNGGGVDPERARLQMELLHGPFAGGERDLMEQLDEMVHPYDDAHAEADVDAH